METSWKLAGRNSRHVYAMQVGNDMIAAVREVSSGIAGFYRELELLQGEMKFFRIVADLIIPLSDAEQ